MYVHKFVVGITALLVLITVNIAHERKREALQYQAELKEAAGKYNQLIVEYNRLVEENGKRCIMHTGPPNPPQAKIKRTRQTNTRVYAHSRVLVPALYRDTQASLDNTDLVILPF